MEVEISAVNGQPDSQRGSASSAQKRPHVRSKDAKRLSGSTNLLSSPLTSTARWKARTPAKATRPSDPHHLLFANPPLEDKPARRSRRVRRETRRGPASEGDWTTLYFLPGIHDVGVAFPLRGDRRLHPRRRHRLRHPFQHDMGEGQKHSHLWTRHPLGSEAEASRVCLARHSGQGHKRYTPIEIVGTPTHGSRASPSPTLPIIPSCSSSAHSEHSQRSALRPRFHWRANGDASIRSATRHPRTASSARRTTRSMRNGLGIRRCVLWNDAMAPHLSSARFLNAHSSLKTVDVIYFPCQMAPLEWRPCLQHARRRQRPGRRRHHLPQHPHLGSPSHTPAVFICMTVPDPYGEGKTWGRRPLRNTLSKTSPSSPQRHR